MDQLWIEVAQSLVPIVVAVLMSIPGILSYRSTIRKDKVEGVAIVKDAEKSDAEAKAVLITAAKSLVEPLVEKIAILEEADKARTQEMSDVTSRLTSVERYNYILCDGVRRLILQIKSLGAIPVFEVDDELCQEMRDSKT